MAARDTPAGLPVPEMGGADFVVYEDEEEPARRAPAAPDRGAFRRREGPARAEPPARQPTLHSRPRTASGTMPFAQRVGDMFILARTRLGRGEPRTPPRGGIASTDDDIEAFLERGVDFQISPAMAAARVLVHSQDELYMLLDALRGGTQLRNLMIKAVDDAYGRVMLQDWTAIMLGNFQMHTLELNGLRILSTDDAPTHTSLRKLVAVDCRFQGMNMYSFVRTAGGVGVVSFELAYTRDFPREYRANVPGFRVILELMPDVRALEFRNCNLGPVWAVAEHDAMHDVLLQELRITHCEIPATELGVLIDRLLYCPYLQRLVLSGLEDSTDLRNVVHDSLARFLRAHPLRRLGFHGILLGTATMHAVFSVCANVKHLTTLSVGGADPTLIQTPSQAAAIAAAAAKLIHVQRLFLDQLDLSADGITRVLEAAAGMPNLHELYLPHRHPDAGADRAIVELFEKNPSIEWVDVEPPSDRALERILALAPTRRVAPNVTGLDRYIRERELRARMNRMRL